jgi:glutathione S-transferase
MDSPLQLFYSPEACSLAAHIALEETGAPFEPCRITLAKNEQRLPKFMSINPKGRVPVLVDGEAVITELPAILLYIAKRFPSARLWPEGLVHEGRCAEWLAWSSSGLHETFAHVRRPDRFADSSTARKEVVEKGRVATLQAWRLTENKLAESKDGWAAGPEYSVADASLLVFWVWGRSKTLAYDMRRDYPAWSEHASKMAKRLAVRRAFAREGLELP